MKKSMQKTVVLIFSLLLVAYFQVTKFSSKSNPSDKNTYYLFKSSSSLPSLKDNSTWKHELVNRVDRIKSVCGELCSINSVGKFYSKAQRFEGSNIPTFTADINCNQVMQFKDIDAVDFTFPQEIPEEILNYYTLNDTIPVIKFNRFFKDANDTHQDIWTKKDIDEKINLVKNDMLKGTYGNKAIIKELKELFQESNMEGKKILVIGSETPWIEALCLHAGAAKVTTLEYGRIKSQHPQVVTLTPKEFRNKYMDGSLGMFDGVVSFSSIEHSGLGRYGDALNPWGDILATARAWCVTNDNGFMVLGLPTGDDKVLFNAHRIYGKYRWPLVATNWHLLNENEASDNYLASSTGHNINHYRKISPSEKFLRTSYKAYSRRPNMTSLAI